MTRIADLERLDFADDDLMDPYGTGVVRCIVCGDYHDPRCGDDVPMVRTGSGWQCEFHRVAA